MRKTYGLLTAAAVVLAAAAGVTAADRWTSDYDLLWTINVYDRCSGTEIVYRNARIVNNEPFWVAFIPGQTRIAEPHGRIIRIPRIDSCLSVAMVSAE